MIVAEGGFATELMPEVSAEVFSSGEQPAHLLFDREDDLAAIDAALAEAVAGAGGVLLIEGPAGIGKTVLLDQLRRRAGALAMTVLTARGGELERGFGFGIVRQLLEGCARRSRRSGARSAAGGCRAVGRAGVHRCVCGRGDR